MFYCHNFQSAEPLKIFSKQKHHETVVASIYYPVTSLSLLFLFDKAVISKIIDTISSFEYKPLPHPVLACGYSFSVFPQIHCHFCLNKNTTRVKDKTLPLNIWCSGHSWCFFIYKTQPPLLIPKTKTAKMKMVVMSCLYLCSSPF